MVTGKNIFLRRACGLLLALGVIVAASIGTAAVSADEIMMSLSITAPAEEETVTVVREDTSLRDEFSKYFVNSDGTVTAVTYPEAIHYYDNGEWLEIDNRLSMKNGRISNNYDNLSVSFAPNANAGEIVNISNGEYGLSWEITAKDMSSTNQGRAISPNRFELSSNSIAEISNISQRAEYISLSNEEKKLSAEKAYSGITYEDAFGVADSIDISYDIRSNKVKESIILNEPTEMTTFETVISAQGLTAELQEDNSIVFADNNSQRVFNIAAPYMFDANNEISYDIDVALTYANGKYILAITPNEEWINDEDRAYPVVIDPTVTIDNSTSNVFDSYTYAGDTLTHGGTDYLYVGNKVTPEGTTKNHIAYIRLVSVPSLPSGAVLMDAHLNLYLSTETPSKKNINVYGVTGSYNTEYFNWSQKPDYSKMDVYTIDENVSTSITTTGYYYYKIDFTDHSYFATKGAVIEYADSSATSYAAIKSSDSGAGCPAFYVTYDTQQTSGINSGGLYRFSITPSSSLRFTGTSDNSPLSVNSYVTGSTEQKFYLIYRGSGEYTIRPYGTYKAVSTDGTNVGLYTDHGDSAQRWYIEKSGDYYKIRSKKYSSYYISTAAASIVKLSTSTNNLFYLEQVNVIRAYNYYDELFLSEKGSATAAKNYINSICNVVSAYYQSVYDITIEFSTQIREFTSKADTVGDAATKEIISADFRQKKINSDLSVVPILWSGGYDLTHKEVLAVTSYNPQNIYGTTRAIILFNSPYSSEREKPASLAHEFGHVFGLCEKNGTVDSSHEENQYCLMRYYDFCDFIGVEIMGDYVRSKVAFFCDQHVLSINTWHKETFIPYCATNF